MADHIAFLIKKDNNFLFIKRSLKKKKLPGAWGLPSGTREGTDSDFDTAKREAMEELGVQVEPQKEFFKFHNKQFDDWVIFVLCELQSGEPSIKAPDEIEEIVWMSFTEFYTNNPEGTIAHGLELLRNQKEIWEDL
ncbi:MAG: 8-oxo-dGTP pyrophosphatase MutT (NUDIX family) [Candidatus Woesearchaeota archaeon]|jgi:8-oxo-dGTP pyrophosphatase MutT (NUDIX family)